MKVKKQVIIPVADTPVKCQVKEILAKIKEMDRSQRPEVLSVREFGSGPELAIALAGKGFTVEVSTKTGRALYRLKRRKLIVDILGKLLWM